MIHWFQKTFGNWIIDTIVSFWIVCKATNDKKSEIFLVEVHVLLAHWWWQFHVHVGRHTLRWELGYYSFCNSLFIVLMKYLHPLCELDVVQIGKIFLLKLEWTWPINFSTLSVLVISGIALLAFQNFANMASWTYGHAIYLSCQVFCSLQTHHS